MSGHSRVSRFSQERIVFVAAALLFLIFAVFSRGFLEIGNLLTLLRNVSILGILAISLAMVVIGRGIDLAMIATMVISSAFFLTCYNSGTPPAMAVLLALALAVCVGLLQGALIAYAEVPAIFTTLAVGIALYGFGQFFLISQDVSYLPQGDKIFLPFGSWRIFQIPIQVVVLLAVALGAHLFLSYTKYGRFIYAFGDNPGAARLIGISTRALTVLQYMISSVLAFGAGLLTVSSVSSMSLRIASSTMIYDVVLVVVIGGISLSGGKGNIRNVMAGTLLIGILLNGMTLLNVPYTSQNIVKGCILLLALMIDSYLNPRDEQTEKQGDI